MRSNESAEVPNERRRFLSGVIAGACAMIAGLTILPGVGMLLSPVLARSRSRRARVILPNTAALTPDDFVAVRYEGQPATEPSLFVRLGDDGNPLVLSAKCTHAGCAVQWRRERGQFLCPCHQGRYDAKGRNIAGPPPRPLDRVPAVVTNGELFVEEPAA